MRSSMIIVAVVALIWGLHNWSKTQTLICEEQIHNAKQHQLTLLRTLNCDQYLSDYRRLKKQRWYIKGLIIDNCPERYFSDLEYLDQGKTVIHFDEEK